MKVARRIDYKMVNQIEAAKRLAYHPPEPEELRGPDNCSNWFVANDGDNDADLTCLTRCGKCRKED